MPAMPPQKPMPQGAPPQAGGPGGAPPQGSPQAGPAGGGSISSLLKNIDSAIDIVAKAVHSSPASSPQEKQLIQQIDGLYGQLMQSLGESAENESAEPGGADAQGQTVPMEAGGNKGAVPSPM